MHQNLRWQYDVSIHCNVLALINCIISFINTLSDFSKSNMTPVTMTL
jgi:hypothetical protein